MVLTHTQPRLPRTASVLILDDNRIDRHRLARLCAGLDMKCTITDAAHLAAFKDAIEGTAFDLILVDYALPDGNGLDALEQVRLSSLNCTAATIMVTGQEQDDLALQALKAGCSDYITKDELAMPSFRRAVTNALQKSVLSADLARQTFRRAEVAAALEHVATTCARDIKPMVSRMMRQLRDLRGAAGPDQPGFQEVETSCLHLWEFLIDLERHQGSDLIAGSVPPRQEAARRRPPSPFAQMPGP